MSSITSANAVYMLSVSDLFSTPIQLQGFSAEDIFTTSAIASAETLMGLDGKLSGGFVFVPVPQSISLQADSQSNTIFDQWWAASQVAKDIYVAQGIVLLTSIGSQWTMTNGYLTSYPPIPDAVRTLRPRRYGITWESISPSPTNL